MLATGPLLLERLYLGIQIISIRGETDSEYQDANNGYFTFKLIQGRNGGATISFGSRITKLKGSYDQQIISYYNLGSTPDQGRGTEYGGWRWSHNLGGNVYPLTIRDNASNTSVSCSVTLEWSGGYVSYNGSNYGVNDIIDFDLTDLRQ